MRLNEDLENHHKLEQKIKDIIVDSDLINEYLRGSKHQLLGYSASIPLGSDFPIFYFYLCDEENVPVFEVRGNIYESENSRNILYSFKKDFKSFDMLEKQHKVSETMWLREIFHISEKKEKLIPQIVSLRISLPLENGKTHVIKVDIDVKSKPYKMYFQQQIDLITLCNMVLSKYQKIKIVRRFDSLFLKDDNMDFERLYDRTVKNPDGTLTKYEKSK